tara:strand:+ start:485 stop:1108 length:624 start_codon:yes stop_codon:yes gene_type:complete
MDSIQLLDFAKRHFSNDFAGTKITGWSPEDWLSVLINNQYSKHPCPEAIGGPIPPIAIKTLDGFAPFCKVLVCENFSSTMSGMARITDSNRHLLQGDWKVRREGEDAYWSTWFNAEDVETEEAKYLHVILYNKEQLKLEGIELDDGKEWGIVSINAEQTDDHVPMHPETMRRNRKGIEAGGNGHQHTDDEIAEAEAYHSQWANVGGE